MSVRHRLAAALVLTVAGVLVLALPDSLEGPRLVEFGPGHGPSTLDLVGIALLTPGASWLLAMLVRALPSLAYQPRTLFGLGAAGGLGLGLLLASVFAGFTGWWAIGALTLTAVELVLLARLWRAHRS
ncbi:hypothetical protein [Micromonospora craterilacus]|uniref:hypothetical protein n=1 Tax=Micromonospora craterilacus TaxID=1655439 RepID=UPI0011B57FF5|nr:hypothetical protein [Micromonospora craterilacus]